MTIFTLALLLATAGPAKAGPVASPAVAASSGAAHMPIGSSTQTVSSIYTGDRSRDPFLPAAQDLQLFMVSGAVPCAADNQGRILISQALRDHARLDKDVVIAGAGTHIQIWDRAAFDQFMARTNSNFRDLAVVVSNVCCAA